MCICTLRKRGMGDRGLAPIILTQNHVNGIIIFLRKLIKLKNPPNSENLKGLSCFFRLLA